MTPNSCTFKPFLYQAISDPHFIQGGGGGVIWTPTISSTLDCTNLKFCKILDIPFKVSKNTRVVKIFLYGYHGNCLITWVLFANNCQKEYEKQVFSNASRNHELQGVNIKLYVMIVLLMFFSKT